LKLFSLIALFLVVFTSQAPIQAFGNMAMGGVMNDPAFMFDSTTRRSNNPEKIVEEFQVQFIEQSFTRPLMDSNATFFEDEEEEGFLSSSQDNEMLNSLMAYMLAKELARRDAFGLKKPLLNQVDRLIETRR
jgi:hypothetical protein